MNRIYYFDHAATTAVDEEVLREMNGQRTGMPSLR